MFIGSRLILNGIKLYETFGLLSVYKGSGQVSSPFGVSQSIMEDKVPFNDVPFFQGVERRPLQFEITFAREKEWNDELRIKFAELLFKKKYQQLVSEDYPFVVYNVICIDNPTKESFNSNRITLSVTFRCDAPHGWSPDTVQTFNMIDNTKKVLYLENRSNINEIEYPIIEIFSGKDNNEISIYNRSDGDRGFKISKLEENEVVNIDNKMGVLKTTVPNAYRYNDFNGKWLRLRQGLNQVEVSGKCIITVKTRVAISI